MVLPTATVQLYAIIKEKICRQRQFRGFMFREVGQANKQIQVQIQTKCGPTVCDYLLASGYKYTRIRVIEFLKISLIFQCINQQTITRMKV